MHHVSKLKTKAIIAWSAVALASSAIGPTYAQSKAVVGAPGVQKFTKPIDGPELPGPITRPGAPVDDEAAVESDSVQIGGSKTSVRPDLAFGAYQRGYYLTAFKLALPRAASGDPAAQALIAEIYWNGRGIAIDRKKAVEWYEFAATAGNRESQFFLSTLLFRGEEVVKDEKRGEELLRKAASQGHVRAQFNLAQLITARRPTWASFRKAMPLYKAAAEAGVADAQYALANIYAEAKGVLHNDDVLARQWLARAANGGFDTAQVEYGIWLANGRGGNKDEKAARGWFARAAVNGNAIAQNRLARMHAFGIGTKTDKIRAGAWHILSRRAGFTDSELDQMFQSLSEIDKKRALEAASQLGRQTRS